jgi:hypothetical protein
MWKRYLAAATMLLAILIMLMVLAPRLYSSLTTGVWGGQVLTFETLDKGSSVRSEKMERYPSIYVIASEQEIDAFAQNVIVVDPQVNDQRARLVEQLRQLEYDGYFVVLALRGISCGSCSLVVQQVVRQDNRVRIGVSYSNPLPMQGQPTVVTEPYEMILVGKEGVWGQLFTFELFEGNKVVAETSHFVP